MERKRDRAIKELYDLTQQISEPKITPILQGTYRMQGPMEEEDHEYAVNKATSESNKRLGKRQREENLCSRSISGTCNVCAAPCSSCLHNNQTLSVVESKAEDALSDESSMKKEADHCSFTNADVVPLKGRRFDGGKQATSEGSNLFSTSSSIDSFSENIESKATRTADTCYVSEDVDMPSRVSTGETVVESKRLTRSAKRRCVSNQDEDKHKLERHGDNISCLTRAKGASDNNIKPDMNKTTCSSENVLQVQLPPEVEETQINAKRLWKHSDECSKKSVSYGSENATFCQITHPPKCMSSTTPLNIQSPPPPSHPRLSSLGNSCLELIEEKSSSQRQAVAPESPMKETILAGSSANNELGKIKTAPDSDNVPQDFGECKVGPTDSDSSPGINNIVQNETDTGPGHEKPCDESTKNMLNEQNGDKTSLLRESEVHGFSTQFLPVDGCNEAEALEDDVKVCDICGDSGREELLAICSRCSDGAEHTYCMRIMLNELPQGEWLCEECKFKEDAKNKKIDVSESVPLVHRGMPKIPSFKGKSQDCGIMFNPKDLPKLDTKLYSATQVVRSLPNNNNSNKKLKDLQDSSIANRKNSEASGLRTPSSGAVSTTPKTALLRENSIKNFSSVLKNHPASSHATPQALSSSVRNTSKTCTILSPQVISPKSSLDSLKTKLHRTSEKANQKSKFSNESVTADSKKEEVVRSLGKSASFKSTSSSCLNTDFTKYRHHNGREDSISTPQLKEKKLLERNDSVVSDLPRTPHLKTDPKNMRTDGKFDCLSKSNSLSVINTAEDANGLAGLDEVKQHPSCSTRISNELRSSLDQRAPQVMHKEHTNPSLNNNDNKPVLSQVRQSTSHDVKHRESVSFCNTRQVSNAGKTLKCQKCNETGHATNVCSIGKLPISAVKPPGERNANKIGSKWKYAVEATMYKNKSCRLSDQPDKLQLPSGNIHSEDTPKDHLWRLSSNDGVFASGGVANDGNFASGGVANDGNFASGVVANVMDNLKNNMSNPSKIAPCNDSKPLVLSTETLVSSSGGLVNTIESKLKSVLQVLPVNAHIPRSSSRVLAVPDYNCIWKGGFEVHKSGKFTNTCNGIQAHLSNCASSRVFEVAINFPTKVQLEEVPCAATWPIQFQSNSPTEENIALYFFATDVESYENNYKKLLESLLNQDLALKGSLCGVDLLIFPSSKLPEQSQCWNGLFFLWGVFRGKKSISSEPVSSFQMKLDESSLQVTDIFSHVADTSISQKENFCPPVDEKLCHVEEIANQTAKTIISIDLMCMPPCDDASESYSINEDKIPHVMTANNSATPGDKLPTSLLCDRNSSNLSKHTSISTYLSQQSSGINDVRVLSSVGGSNAGLKEPMHQPNAGKNMHLTEAEARLTNIEQIHLSENMASPSCLFTRDGMRVFPDSMKISSPIQGTHTENIMCEEETNADGKLITFQTTSSSIAPRVTPLGQLSCWHSVPDQNISCSYSQEPAYGAVLKETEGQKESLFHLKELKKESLHVQHEQGGTHCAESAGPSFLTNAIAPFLGRTTPQSSQGSERHFFPVGLDCLRDVKPAATSIPPEIVVLDDDDDETAIAAPTASALLDLNLALGAKESPVREVLHMFHPLIGTAREEPKPQNSLIDEEDDGLASLSLSLGFP